MNLNSGVLLIFITIIVDVKSYIIWGENTNLTLIIQRIMDIGDGLIKVKSDPNLQTGRKAFANNVLLVVKKPVTRTPEEFNDDDLRKVMEKKKQEIPSPAREQHNRKISEIVEFLKTHYLTTDYLYDEVQRIKKQRKVKDALRRMVEFLELPTQGKLKREVLKYYYDNRIIPITDEYPYKTNNLIINVLKDPYNDGLN